MREDYKLEIIQHDLVEGKKLEEIKRKILEKPTYKLQHYVYSKFSEHKLNGKFEKEFLVNFKYYYDLIFSQIHKYKYDKNITIHKFEEIENKKGLFSKISSEFKFLTNIIFNRYINYLPYSIHVKGNSATIYEPTGAFLSEEVFPNNIEKLLKKGKLVKLKLDDKMFTLYFDKESQLYKIIPYEIFLKDKSGVYSLKKIEEKIKNK